MVMYDYRCPNCKEVEEHDHGINETPFVECSKCGVKHSNKIISGTVTFNGCPTVRR